MLKDILLTVDGDLLISATGDISPTDSIRQAVRIRLLWVLDEWRFAPQYGTPYFESVLIKKPDVERIRRIIRDEVMAVKGVLDVRNIEIRIDAPARRATASLDVVLEEMSYREEVDIYNGLWRDS